MKPAHLGLKYAEVFKHKSVAEAYNNRPPYPMETFNILKTLIGEEHCRVLDVGCGTGFICRYLINFVDYIDAVDFSENMINEGRNLPNGELCNINWICSSVEQAVLKHKYKLITAGACLHWMEWEVVLPKFCELLEQEGFLAIINDSNVQNPWDEELRELIKMYSTNKEFKPYNLVKELEIRNLFLKVGEKNTEPITFKQSFEAYIKSFHARNGFSREEMGDTAAERFDYEVRKLLIKYCDQGIVELKIYSEIVWGKPLNKAFGE